MTNEKSKKIIKDTFLFALAMFVPKAISFFLVPLYTTFLSASAYGTYDILNTISSLLIPIITLDIADAVLIYTVFNRNVKSNVNLPLKFAINYLLRVYLLFGILLILAWKINNFNAFYLFYLYFQCILTSLYSIYISYCRGVDDSSTIVISSIINSVSIILFNILFILIFKMQLYGLFISSVLGIAITDVFLSYKVKIINIMFSNKNIKKSNAVEMLKYSSPLILNGIFWWINSSSDKFFIKYFCGVSYNGIYAVANKLPTILTIFHNVFIQATQLSIFNEINNSDKISYYNKLYGMYSFVMIMFCSIIICGTKILSNLLFKRDFYVAWKICPALLICVLLFSLFGYLSVLCSVEKNTIIILTSTIIGATANTILNIVLIPKFYLYGAAIATLFGYFIIWLSMLLHINRKFFYNLHYKKIVLSLLALIFQWISLLIFENFYIVHFVIISFIFLLYIHDFHDLLIILKRIIHEYL